MARHEWLQMQELSIYHDKIFKLMPRWEKCISDLLTSYEGESNENIKSAIEIRNTARLSCKLTRVILMV